MKLKNVCPMRGPRFRHGFHKLELLLMVVGNGLDLLMALKDGSFVARLGLIFISLIQLIYDKVNFDFYYKARVRC